MVICFLVFKIAEQNGDGLEVKDIKSRREGWMVIW